MALSPSACRRLCGGVWRRGRRGPDQYRGARSDFRADPDRRGRDRRCQRRAATSRPTPAVWLLAPRPRHADGHTVGRPVSPGIDSPRQGRPPTWVNVAERHQNLASLTEPLARLSVPSAMPALEQNLWIAQSAPLYSTRGLKAAVPTPWRSFERGASPVECCRPEGRCALRDQNEVPVELLDLRTQVPVIDGSDVHPGESHREEFLGQLISLGFLAFELPGIGQRVDQLHREFGLLCDADSRLLNRISPQLLPQSGNGGNHGYFRYGSEVPRLANGVADPKEFIHVSGAMLDDQPRGSHLPISLFPEFGRVAGSVYSAAFDLAESFAAFLTEAIRSSRSISLRRDATILRVIRYRNSPDREILAHEHSGIQMLGVQLPPSEQGLQYLLPDGRWVEPLLSGTDIVLVNIGRMLSYASGGSLQPSVHRVMATEDNPASHRFSSVLFAHPDHREEMWRVQEGDLTTDSGTWGDFVHKRLEGLGIKASPQTANVSPWDHRQ